MLARFACLIFWNSVIIKFKIWIHYCSKMLQIRHWVNSHCQHFHHWKFKTHWWRILLTAVLIHSPSSASGSLLMFPVSVSGLFQIGVILRTSNIVDLWTVCLILPQEPVTRRSHLLVWSLYMCLCLLDDSWKHLN